jgi:hypothetical protein
MEKEKYNWMIFGLICCLALVTIFLLIFDKGEINPEVERDKILEKCLERVNPILYGIESYQAFQSQKEELGELFEKVQMIDCIQEKEKCVGVLLVPAWRVKEQLYYGSFSKDVLIKIWGCEDGV